MHRRTSSYRFTNYSAYQSECADHRPQERHCVSVHLWRQAGHTPPVSNVFHACPQVHDQRSSSRGDQPHNGHRMRGPEVSPLLSSAGSWSMTGVELCGSANAIMESLAFIMSSKLRISLCSLV